MSAYSQEELRHIKRVLETALLTAAEPLDLVALSRLFADTLAADVLGQCLADLMTDWSDRGVELLQTGQGWRFRAKPEYQPYIDRLQPEKPARYSRAVMETLAIIAYRQPVTRGDIEAIRGVAVSSEVMRKLEDRGWIELVGHRDVPGRPGLFATTVRFLQDFNLRTLADLPPLSDLGELDKHLSAIAETTTHQGVC